jgi:tRNA (guanine37-N1)-methyltransferase
MIFNVLTLFPEMFLGLEHSMIGKAKEKKLIEINLINIRDFSNNKHHKVDDYPYGGGPGMVMQVQPIFDGIKSLKEKGTVVYLSPKGKNLNQEMLKKWSEEEVLTLLCGHYEGVDQRVIDDCVDIEVSIGDYVLTGGEIPAMVIIDGVSRLKEGVLNKSMSYEDESHYNGLLEYPHYTRPADYKGLSVPKVLLSGNHAAIEAFRFKESIELTKKRRPDLYEKWIKTEKYKK